MTAPPKPGPVEMAVARAIVYLAIYIREKAHRLALWQEHRDSARLERERERIEHEVSVFFDFYEANIEKMDRGAKEYVFLAAFKDAGLTPSMAQVARFEARLARAEKQEEPTPQS